MKPYFTFTKKALVAILSGLILLVLLIGSFASVNQLPQNARTNAQRIAFIQGLGYEPLEECIERKTITIPESFSSVYEQYNLIQKQAGFDLSEYKGVKAEIYVYKVQTPKGREGETVANLIVYNNRIIGGDISSRELDGFMLALKG